MILIRIISDYDLVSGTFMEYFGRQAALGESFEQSIKRLDWNITKLVHHFTINGQHVHNNETGVWNPVIDSVLGLCYTFNPKTFQNGLVPIKYHAHNGQIHRTEIQIEFNVR